MCGPADSLGSKAHSVRDDWHLLAASSSTSSPAGGGGRAVTQGLPTVTTALIVLIVCAQALTSPGACSTGLKPIYTTVDKHQNRTRTLLLSSFLLSQREHQLLQPRGSDVHTHVQKAALEV